MGLKVFMQMHGTKKLALPIDSQRLNLTELEPVEIYTNHLNLIIFYLFEIEEVLLVTILT